MENTNNLKLIQDDILRYKTNKVASMLAILGLVFNCLYFTLLYGIKTTVDVNGANTKFVTIDIGFSVIVTLLTLLLIFLSSEGIKNYNKKYSIMLLVLAVVQIVRIFGYPLYGAQNLTFLNVNYFFIDNAPGVILALLIVYLAASAGCLIGSAVIGYLTIVRLEKHLKLVEPAAEGLAPEVDIMQVIAQMDKEEAQAAASQNASEEEVH